MYQIDFEMRLYEPYAVGCMPEDAIRIFHRKDNVQYTNADMRLLIHFRYCQFKKKKKIQCFSAMHCMHKHIWCA